jgi:arginase
MAGRVEHLGISVDLDGLDPRFAPAVGTPVEGGLDAAELLDALRGLARDPRLVGLEIAEFNPCLDVEHKTRDLLVELVAIFAGDRGSP